MKKISIVLNYSVSACACMCVHKSANASASRGIGYLWTDVTNGGATWHGYWDPNSDNHESAASTFNLWTIIFEHKDFCFHELKQAHCPDDDSGQCGNKHGIFLNCLIGQILNNLKVGL